MPNQHNPSRVKAALTGALVCALLGPLLGTIAILASEMVHEHEYSGRGVVSALSVLFWVLPVAVSLVGPGAFVLGGLGTLVIQFRSARLRSAKDLLLQVTVLGLMLGAAVPIVADLMYTALWGDRNKNFEKGLLPLGAVTGLVCTAVVYSLLRAMRLLRFQEPT